MSNRSLFANQMHELAVEISDFLGECTTLHPLGDEVCELCNLQALAQAFGDYLSEEDVERCIKKWLEHARGRLAAIQSWAEVVDAQRIVQELSDNTEKGGSS